MRARTRSTGPRRFLLLALAAAVAGCTTRMSQGPGAGLVAQLSLERFLQAANARDLEAMGRLFGTENGAAWDTGNTFSCMFQKIGSWFGSSPCVKKDDVEIRMDAISQVLRHEDYRIVREEPVAGRSSQARTIYVDLTVAGRQVTGVPFLLVRTGGGQWLVEEIDLERVMARPLRQGNPAAPER